MVDPVTPPMPSYMRGTVASTARGSNSKQPNGTTHRDSGHRVSKATAAASVARIQDPNNSRVTERVLRDSDTVSESSASSRVSSLSRKSSKLSGEQGHSRGCNEALLTHTCESKGKGIETLNDIQGSSTSKSKGPKNASKSQCYQLPVDNLRALVYEEGTRALAAARKAEKDVQQTIEDQNRQLQELKNQCTALRGENTTQKDEITKLTTMIADNDDSQVILREEKADIERKLAESVDLVYELAEELYRANQENDTLQDRLIDVTDRLDTAQLSTALEMSEAALASLRDNTLHSTLNYLPTPPSSPSPQPAPNQVAVDGCIHPREHWQPQLRSIRNLESRRERKIQVATCGICGEGLNAVWKSRKS